MANKGGRDTCRWLALSDKRRILSIVTATWGMMTRFVERHSRESLIHNPSYLFLANSIMATSVVVSCVFLPSDHVLRVEQVAVGSRPHLDKWISFRFSNMNLHLVDNGGLEVDKNRSRHVLPRWRLREERVEGVVRDSQSVIRGHLTVRHNPWPWLCSE